jgi:hypothetical protein
MKEKNHPIPQYASIKEKHKIPLRIAVFRDDTNAEPSK